MTDADLTRSCNNMTHAAGTMKNAIGIGKPGEPVDNRPHLGDLILQKYEGILHTGFEHLERFELIDRLEKPVLDLFLWRLGLVI